MRVFLSTATLLAAVAVSVAVPGAPAEAQSSGRAGFSSGNGGQNVKFGQFTDRRHDGRRHRGFGDSIVLDSDFDGGSAWRHDSFNDWWHERPNRAYPKWMTSGTCDRVYWAGGGWRC